MPSIDINIITASHERQIRAVDYDWIWFQSIDSNEMAEAFNVFEINYMSISDSGHILIGQKADYCYVLVLTGNTPQIHHNIL